MQSVFGTKPEDILLISAKAGKGVSGVLQTIVDHIPPPTGKPSDPMKTLLFDSSYDGFHEIYTQIKMIDCCYSLRYDRFRGVVSLVNLQSGTLSKGQN